MDTKNKTLCDITEFLPDECVLFYSEGKDQLPIRIIQLFFVSAAENVFPEEEAELLNIIFINFRL
jgi:hypothetical protein